jgi:hypothetical protein
MGKNVRKKVKNLINQEYMQRKVNKWSSIYKNRTASFMLECIHQMFEYQHLSFVPGHLYHQAGTSQAQWYTAAELSSQI